MLNMMHLTLSSLPPLVVAMTLVFLTTASAHDLRSNVNEDDDPVWRSPHTVHHIQAEMRPYVLDMIHHAFGSYIKYAFPMDDLLAVGGKGRSTMGGYGWTLIDSLDTLAVAGLHTEFRRYAKWAEESVNFDIDISVSVFETTIRIVGGLLSAHFMYEEGVVEIVPAEHNYTGGLLRLAVDLADRLFPSFKTPKGIPHPAVNLRKGFTSGFITNNAEAGSLLLEMTALSRILGNEKYERAARTASEAMFAARDPTTELMGNYVHVHNGFLEGSESHLAGGIDSTIEYFIKAHKMTGNIGDWKRFERSVRAINRYVRKGGMMLSVYMGDGKRKRCTHESLSSFFPGNLVLGGHHAEAVESNWPVHTLFKHFGGLPESFPLDTAELSSGSQYVQRPEHAESVYMLYRATRDPAYLVMGRELALGINLRMRTPYGFSTLNNIGHPHHDGKHDDWMESFMVAETLKYLYLLFDECNVVHLTGRISGSIPPYCTPVEEKNGLGSRVGWVFNTEAHLFPDTAEWWPPASADDREAGTELENQFHRRRLEVVDGLLDSIDKATGASGGVGSANGGVSHQYYCSNHPHTDVGRISTSIIR